MIKKGEFFDNNKENLKRYEQQALSEKELDMNENELAHQKALIEKDYKLIKYNDVTKNKIHITSQWQEHNEGAKQFIARSVTL